MTDYERGYEQGKVDAARKMHPEIRKCLEDYFDKCFSSYREGLETYREGILVGPCFCRRWPGGVPPIRHWAGLTDEEVKDFQVNKFIGPNLIRAIERRLKEKNS